MDMLDAVAAADVAGLIYVNDTIPGITRERRGEIWAYQRPDGALIDEPSEHARIDAIGIPPAWTHVWISPIPEGHILATGRDAKGRKQYRYHPRFREVRDGTKYHRMGAFGEALPGLRIRIEDDLSLTGLPRNRVLAAAVRLMDETLIRIGSGDVNAYLRATTAAIFTAKDFRTWGGSVTAAETLVDLGPPRSPADAKRKIVAAIDAAAARLNNTRAVFRKSYLHPRVPEAWVDGTLNDAFTRAEDREHFSHSEAAVLGVIAP